MTQISTKLPTVYYCAKRALSSILAGPGGDKNWLTFYTQKLVQQKQQLRKKMRTNCHFDILAGSKIFAGYG